MTVGSRSGEVQSILDLAKRIAVQAGDVTLQYFGRVVEHDAKGDGSPVTIADREAEALLRSEIESAFPEHSILGEEYGASNEGARVQWILDPIDATRSFMRGVPLYGVLIGVEIEGESVVGVAHFPALGETVAAGDGLGCTWNGEPCQVSDVDALSDAVVCTTDVERLLSRPIGPAWRSLQQQAAFSRTWGDCYGHLLVATGRIEVQVDPIMAPWDAGPFLTIAREAGGRFTTLDGAETVHGGSGVSSNGRLHDEVLRILSER
ncbi:MAG: inositol monophosphatase family protein [Gemmatimonadota bacterium]